MTDDKLTKVVEAEWNHISAVMQEAIAKNNSNVGEVIENKMLYFLQRMKCLITKPSCDDTFLFQMFMGYLVVPIFVICVLANTCNITVYTMEYFQKYVAVKMLAVKAIMNTVFVLCFFPSALKTIGAWNPIDNKVIEHLYWKVWPYILTAMNTFGTCAMWVTVLMTLERYLYIVRPIASPQWVTDKSFFISLIIIFLLSFCLQSVYLITRRVVVTFCSFQSYNKYQYTLREEDGYLEYEKIFHWLNLCCSIVIPLILLLVMSISICYKLVYKQSTVTRYSQWKRCINRITFSTTIVHLLLEIPSMVIFAAAAVGGPKWVNDIPFMCNWHIFATFLTICNSSVMFFIYMVFSSKFRQMFMVRITCGRYAAAGFSEEATSFPVSNRRRSQSFTLSRDRQTSSVRHFRPISMSQGYSWFRHSPWFKHRHESPTELRDACRPQSFTFRHHYETTAEMISGSVLVHLRTPAVKCTMKQNVPDIVVSCH